MPKAKVTTKPSKLSKVPVLSIERAEAIRAQVKADKALIGRAENRTADPDDDEGVSLSPTQAVAGFDTGVVRNRVKRLERKLAVMDPRERVLSGVERQKAIARHKWLKEWLQAHLLTREDQGAYPDPKDRLKQSFYEQAVQKSIKLEVGHPQFPIFADEFKTLGRLIDPDDPELCDIEALRADGAKSGRHFQG